MYNQIPKFTLVNMPEPITQPEWLRLATADQETEFYSNEGTPNDEVEGCLDVRVRGGDVLEFSRRVRSEIVRGMREESSPNLGNVLALLDSPWWHLTPNLLLRSRSSAPVFSGFRLRRGPLSDGALDDLQTGSGVGFSASQMRRIAYLRGAPISRTVLDTHRSVTGERGRSERQAIRHLNGAIPSLRECSKDSGHLAGYDRPPEFEPALPLSQQKGFHKFQKVYRDFRVTYHRAAIEKREALDTLIGEHNAHLLLPAMLFSDESIVSERLMARAKIVIEDLMEFGNDYLFKFYTADQRRCGISVSRSTFEMETSESLLIRFLNVRSTDMDEFESSLFYLRSRDRLKRRALTQPARMEELEGHLAA